MSIPFSSEDLGRIFDARTLTKGRSLVLLGAVEVTLAGPTITAMVEPCALRSGRSVTVFDPHPMHPIPIRPATKGRPYSQATRRWPEGLARALTEPALPPPIAGSTTTPSPAVTASPPTSSRTGRRFP